MHPTETVTVVRKVTRKLSYALGSDSLEFVQRDQPSPALEHCACNHHHMLLTVIARHGLC